MSDVLNTASGLWSFVSDWLDRTAMWISTGAADQLDTLWIVGLLAAGLLLTRVLLFRRAPVDVNLRDATRRPRFFGYATAVLLIGSMTIWSVFAPLASASIAFGVVSPDGSRKEVSHLEGGIVRKIHVREGDTVQEGAPLVTLEDVHARADYGELNDRLLYLLANRARLEAQRDDRAEMVLPDELYALDGSAEVIDSQTKLLNSQRAALLSREKIQQQRILQIDEHTKGLEQVILAQHDQLDLLATEIADLDTLLKKGLAQASRLYALQRDHAALSAEISMNRARISENEQVISETELQLLNLHQEVIEEANNQLASVENQIAEVRSKLASREDVLARTVIKAPNDGTVLNLKVSTIGGVVQPGQPLLELVPADALLIIDAHVKPNDIDRVHPEMTARIVLSAYKQRNLPMIHGKVLSVSADRLKEDRTGEPYYLAKVEVAPLGLESDYGVELIPGMPAEVLIVDSERSFMRYLLDPITSSFGRSFRED